MKIIFKLLVSIIIIGLAALGFFHVIGWSVNLMLHPLLLLPLLTLYVTMFIIGGYLVAKFVWGNEGNPQVD